MIVKTRNWGKIFSKRLWRSKDTWKEMNLMNRAEIAICEKQFKKVKRRENKIKSIISLRGRNFSAEKKMHARRKYAAEIFENSFLACLPLPVANYRLIRAWNFHFFATSSVIKPAQNLYIKMPTTVLLTESSAAIKWATQLNCSDLLPLYASTTRDRNIW